MGRKNIHFDLISKLEFDNDSFIEIYNDGSVMLCDGVAKVGINGKEIKALIEAYQKIC